MNKNTAVYVPEGSFRSKLIPVAAGLSALAVLAGVLSALILFAPNSLYYLYAQSTDLSSKLTWAILYIILLIFGSTLAALTAIGLFSALFGKIESGMNLFSFGTRILRGAVTVIGFGLLAIFAFRTVLLTIVCLKINEGIMYLFSIMLGELVLAGIAALLIILLRRFLDCAGDTAASTARTIRTGILKTPSISAFASVGFLGTGLAFLLLGVDRITCVSHFAAQGIPSIYAFMLYCSAAMTFLSCAAYLLLALYLRKFKQTSEYLLFKGTPVEEKETSEN